MRGTKAGLIQGFAVSALVANLLLAFWSWSVRPESSGGFESAPATLNQVILLDELTPTERERLRTGLPATRAQQSFAELEVEVEPLPEGGCYLYSLPTRDQLVRFEQRLEAHVSNVYMGEQVAQSPGAIMLYIPPLPSFRQAQIELGELRAAGVDGFIIPDGDLANGISVGVFNSESNLQQRTAQLNRLGYALQRYQYVVERPVYAVNLPVPGRLQISDQIWDEIEADFPQLATSQNSCWKVASTSNFH